MAKRTIAGSRGIVTGASSGIGRAIAVELARHGAKLAIVARRRDRLEQLVKDLEFAQFRRDRPSDSIIEIFPGDIRDPAIRNGAIEHAVCKFGGLDFLVNAAGISAVSRFAESSSERLREIMEVNFFAPAEMIRTAIPVLRQGNRPIIVNVGSILGHRGIPWHADYCASKFALRGFSESLRPELTKLGIDLLVVSPGTTKTELYATDSGRDKLPWRQPKGVSTEYVAKQTVQAMEHGQREIIPNLQGRLLVYLNRYCPWLVNRLFANKG